mmetsp:Transcript_107521/g.219442  ORF Transcript_107521/g.219442 Transcript_107521/m.219442 type:complete len:502 (-) Transcript_107521:1067-2572(-)
MRDFVSTVNGVVPVGSFSAQKGTSLLLLRVEQDESEGSRADSGDGDRLDRFSQKLWDTWFVAPNLNRVTALADDAGGHLVEGNIRKGVVPAVFRALSEIRSGDGDAGAPAVSLRLAVFPPKLQRALLDGLEDYNERRKGDENDPCGSMEVRFSPGNPTHTISVVQLHPGVVATPGSKGDNEKALYVLGRLEGVSRTAKNRKRSLSEGSSNGDNKYRFQQQSTGLVPQQQTKHQIESRSETGGTGSAHNSNLKIIEGSAKSEPIRDTGQAIDGEDEKSISRAYWKLQEAWERYRYEVPSLYDDDGAGTITSDDAPKEPMWTLDCGAAPGGWTKFLFRPGIVGRIYAVDPGKLSPEVFPGLDNGVATTNSGGGADEDSSPTRIVRYLDTTIQKALPELARQLKDAVAGGGRNNPFLDIWVSDMCCKDMPGQIDCFLQARSERVIGAGTFFVLTIKCVVGYSATAFEHQTKEQVKRLEGISRDVHVVHLFSNRSSERTLIGYLV